MRGWDCDGSRCRVGMVVVIVGILALGVSTVSPSAPSVSPTGLLSALSRTLVLGLLRVGVVIPRSLLLVVVRVSVRFAFDRREFVGISLVALLSRARFPG